MNTDFLEDYYNSAKALTKMFDENIVRTRKIIAMSDKKFITPATHLQRVAQLKKYCKDKYYFKRRAARIAKMIHDQKKETANILAQFFGVAAMVHNNKIYI